MCLSSCAQLYNSEPALKIRGARPQDCPEFARPLLSVLAPKEDSPFPPPPKKIQPNQFTLSTVWTTCIWIVNFENLYSRFDRVGAGKYLPLQAEVSEPHNRSVTPIQRSLIKHTWYPGTSGAAVHTSDCSLKWQNPKKPQHQHPFLLH